MIEKFITLEPFLKSFFPITSRNFSKKNILSTIIFELTVRLPEA